MIADFELTRECESKAIENLATELHTLTVDIKKKLDDVEERGEMENQEFRRLIKKGEEDTRKVS